MTLAGNRSSLARPSAYIDDGVKPVFRVKTRLGRTIRTTITHPFYDRRMEQARVVGRRPRRGPAPMPVFGREPLGTHRMKLLALMLGDVKQTCAFHAYQRKPRPPRGLYRGSRRVRRSRRAGGNLGRHAYAYSVRLCRSGARAAASTDVRLDLAPGGPDRDVRREIAGRALVSPASLTHWSQGRTVPTLPPPPVA